MTLGDNEVAFVGYWNGDQVCPEIISKPQEGYKLVLVTVVEPFENEDLNTSEINKVSRKLESQSLELKRTTKKVNKVNKSLKQLNRIINRFK